MTNERRGARRVPFEAADGILAVLFKSGTATGPIALTVLDVSETGFRFALDPDTENDFSVGESLRLEKIVGTQNIVFESAIELIIRWQRKENGSEQITMGCEIDRMAAETGVRFRKFVRSEMAFGGAATQPQANPADRERTPKGPDVDRTAQPHHGMPSTPVKGRSRARHALLLGLFGLVILLSTAASTLSVAPSGQNAPPPETVATQSRVMENRMTTLEVRLAELSTVHQQCRHARVAQEQRIAELAEKVALLEQEVAMRSTTAETASPVAGEPDERKTYHVVQEGETLFRISVRYNVPLGRLTEINRLTPQDVLHPGRKIRIPRNPILALDSTGSP